MRTAASEPARKTQTDRIHKDEFRRVFERSPQGADPAAWKHVVHLAARLIPRGANSLYSLRTKGTRTGSDRAFGFLAYTQRDERLTDGVLGIARQHQDTQHHLVRLVVFGRTGEGSISRRGPQ